MKLHSQLPRKFALGVALLCCALPAAADDIEVAVPVAVCVPVGHVASLTGSADAAGPGGTRSLACGDTLCEGDSVTTAAGSADVQLARGGVRVIDPSSGDAPARLAALGADAAVVGNDAEGHVLSEKAGAYALLCEWDEPLTVARGPQSAVAGPGECVVAKPSEPLYTAPGHPGRIPALKDTCDPPLAISPLGHLDPLPPIAGGPPTGPPLPEFPPFPPPSPCDQPGVGCVEPPGLDEQKPTDDQFPGGGNEDGVQPTL